MTVHMQNVPLEEAIAAIEATPVIERKMVDPDTEETFYDELTVEEAIDFAEASTWRCWVKAGRTVFWLRMELADEVVSLTSVAPV